jgi:E3 ubiquitin-protein ligase SHPRH
VQYIQSVPPQPDGSSQETTARPVKRPKTTRVHDAICIAREQLTIQAPQATVSQENPAVARGNVGKFLALKLRNTNPDDPSQGNWQLHISPRAKSPGRGFLVCLNLDASNVSPQLKTAFSVVETQGFDSGDEGCLWAAVDISVRLSEPSVQLDLSIEVKWNERVTIFGSERANSNPQQALRDAVLETWYPDLHLRKAAHGMQPSWSPQDFYEAACVPDKDAQDAEISSMEIPKLQAKLYPFQRRAVQWLLQREGVHWCQSSQEHEAGIQPYNPPASSEPPISVAPVKDADGNIIHMSPLLGAATRDTTLFQSLQDLRGGILAEEMGLGKTLEMIALILLHRRPESPIMTFDYFLGRELLTTSATLIVAPSSLLDQWLSELDSHAPALKVMFYPGIRKLAKLKDADEISAEHLAEQDVVITTYEVLRTEIWAASDEPGRSMRNEKQYERLKSPLVQLSWWRVCIDEAQMVENWANNAAKLARRIPRVNAWGVTGTPVKDDIQKGKTSLPR